jgi:hypothetical protein
MFPTRQFSLQSVSQWLKQNGFERFEQNFAKVPAKMLPYLHRTDLIDLKIPVMDKERSLNKLWEAIKKLDKELPPPFEPVDENVETFSSDFFLFIHQLQ